MKLSRIGRASLATVVSLAVGLGMTACGGGTIGFMWVLAGKQTSNGSGNSITGFKIDNFTGNLTEVVNSPFTSGGVNPVQAVVKPGGRFVYAVNAGDPTTGTAGNISLFSVGGDGILSFQQTYSTQGDVSSQPVFLQMDTAGGFLYVLDTQAPFTRDASGNITNAIPAGCTIANCGAITVFSVAADTGRLTLVTNATTKNTAGTNITYFPVGPTPTLMKYVSGTILAVNSAASTGGFQTVTAYTANATSGQLALTTNSTQVTALTSITSITTGGNYVFLTDATSNSISAFTLGTGGVLQSVTGGPVTNFVSQVTPVWTLTDSGNKFVYVLNQTSTNVTTSFSSIGAYTIDSNGKLTKVSDTNNPYPVGAGPVCMVEDPLNKYVYTSNANDGSVTGYEINKSTGQLNVLRRGSTFAVTGKPTCLIVSGNVS